MYLGIYIYYYVKIIYEKRSYDFEKEWLRVYGWVWRIKVEVGNDVIMILKIN